MRLILPYLNIGCSPFELFTIIMSVFKFDAYGYRVLVILEHNCLLGKEYVYPQRLL